MPQTIGTPSNAITALPELAWRTGLNAPPYTLANASGGFDLAPRKYPNVDVPSHENTGRNELVMPVRFFFINTLASGADVDLFPGLFQEWVDAVVFDSAPDKFRHPFFGEIDARVQTWSVELVAERTAGVLMDVTWVETNLDPENDAISDFAPVALATAIVVDDDMEELDIEFPTGERHDSFEDMMRAIEGAIFSARLTIQGQVNQALGIIESVQRVVEEANTSVNWALDFNLKQLYSATKELGESAAVQPARITKKIITGAPETLDSLATIHGNTVGELITLNPQLLTAPSIKIGVPVLVFAA